MRKFIIITVFFSWMCVSVVNYDTAKINYKSKNVRTSGYFEGGVMEVEEISMCASTSRKTRYTFGKIGLNHQMGYGISKNLEIGGQFGGEIGKQKEENNASSSFTYLYSLGYLKIGGKKADENLALKLGFGGGIFYSAPDFGFFPLGYADLMFGFSNPEKLTLYGGINFPLLYRFGLNLNFSRFSLLGQVNFSEGYFFSIKLGTGYKF